MKQHFFTFLKMGLASVFLTILTFNSTKAQITIFSENVGAASVTTKLPAYTGWQNQGVLTFDSGQVAASADVRSTSISSTYVGASGGGNVYFSATAGSYGFSIEGINAATYSNLQLNFGYRKESASALPTFSVDYWNGTSWVTVANTSGTLFNEAANASSTWYLSKTLSLPAGAQINGLKIRFVKSGSTAIRLDDIKLTGTSSASISVSSATLASALTSTYGTASTAQTVSVTGSGLTDNLIATSSNANVEVSSNGTSYGSTATFAPTSNAVSGTLFVRLSSSAAVGSYNITNITLTSTNATNKTVSTRSSGNTVSPKALTISGVSANNKAYDNTNAATLSGTPSLVGVVGSDVVSVSGTPTATFAQSFIGSNVPISISGYSLLGTNAGNYSLTQPSLSANITPKNLTITGVSIADKVIDGNSNATILGIPTLQGVISGDSVFLSGNPFAQFTSASVGSNIPVDVSGFTISGSDTMNYFLTQPTGLSANITKASQSITFPAIAAKYSTDAPFTLSATATSGLSVSFESLDTNILKINGNTATIVSYGTVTIAAKQLGNIFYDSATIVNQTLTINRVASTIAAWELTGLSNYGPSPFTPSTSDTNLTITGLTRGSGFGTSGTAASNAWGGSCTVVTSKAAAITSNSFWSFTVSPKVNLKVSFYGIDTMWVRRPAVGHNSGQWQYQINNNGFVDFGPQLAFVKTGSSTLRDTIAPISMTSVAALQNIEEGTTVTFRLVLWGATGTSGTTYIVSKTGNDLILKAYINNSIPIKNISISGISIQNKQFDNTNIAFINGNPQLNGVDLNDTVFIGGQPIALFNDATIGTNKPVNITGYSIYGPQSWKYRLNQPITLSADIFDTICRLTPTFIIGDTLSFCDSIEIDAKNSGNAYVWKNGETTQKIKVINTGWYSVQINSQNCTLTDSVYVQKNLEPRVILSLPDTIKSTNTSVTLNPGSANSFLWSTGETTPTITVNNSGKYSVLAYNSAGCSTTDTTLVLFSRNAPRGIAANLSLMNYQATLANSTGKPMSNQTIKIRFSIQDSLNTNYSEWQSVQTDSRGHIAVQVGNGNKIYGSLEGIAWWDGLNRTLKTEIDTTGTGNWIVLGNSQLVSVPSALYALKSGDGSSSIYGSIEPNGNILTGNGFSVTPLGNGSFDIDFQQPFTEVPIFWVKSVGSGNYSEKIISISASKVSFQVTGSPNRIQFEAKGK